MDHWPRFGIVVRCFLLVFLLTGCAVAATEAPAPLERTVKQPEVPAPEKEAGGLLIETFCSPTRIRTGVARLSWETKPELVESQRIEVTIFKDGFQKGLFGSMIPLKPRQPFQPPEVKEPELRALAPVTDLRLADVRFEREQGVNNIEVEGLEPGLIYFWRLFTLIDDEWVPGETVQVEAPVCVADMKEGE